MHINDKLKWCALRETDQKLARNCYLIANPKESYP